MSICSEKRNCIWRNISSLNSNTRNNTLLYCFPSRDGSGWVTLCLKYVGPGVFLISGIFIQNVLVGQTSPKPSNPNSTAQRADKHFTNTVSEEPYPSPPTDICIFNLGPHPTASTNICIFNFRKIRVCSLNHIAMTVHPASGALEKEDLDMWNMGLWRWGTFDTNGFFSFLVDNGSQGRFLNKSHMQSSLSTLLINAANIYWESAPHQGWSAWELQQCLWHPHMGSVKEAHCIRNRNQVRLGRQWRLGV